MIILGKYLSLSDIEIIISPISYDLINSCQVRDKFSSTKLLGTKFSWSGYFVWDIPLWTFQKVPTYPLLSSSSGNGWAKRNLIGSVLYLFDVWVPVQTRPVRPIFLGSIQYSCKFSILTLDALYIFEKHSDWSWLPKIQRNKNYANSKGGS